MKINEINKTESTVNEIITRRDYFAGLAMQAWINGNLIKENNL